MDFRVAPIVVSAAWLAIVRSYLLGAIDSHVNETDALTVPTTATSETASSRAQNRVAYAAVMATGTESAGRRARRKPGEVRELLVGVARRTFIESGYQGASLRQIAMKADTTQAVLYRYFPSKSDLFKESVLRPFEDFVARLVEDWLATSALDLSTHDLIAGFTRSLYDFTATHRGLIMALLAADAHSDDSMIDTKTSFAHPISTVVGRALDDAVSRGWADIDVEVAVPATMAMIISTALLDDWIFPRTQRPDHERILTELTRYEIRAIAGEA